MMDYKQPDFYHFNQDSTKLIHFLHDRVLLEPKTILDLGAGCGVLGIEYALKSKNIEIHFVEMQNIFLPYIEMNMKLFLPEMKYQIFHQKFSQLQNLSKYDLIISNPPYFHPGSGQKNASPERQIARSWEIDDLSVLVQVVKDHLTPQGEAWISLPNDSKTNAILARFQRIEMYPQSEKLNYVRVLL